MINLHVRVFFSRFSNLRYATVSLNHFGGKWTSLIAKSKNGMFFIRHSLYQYSRITNLSRLGHVRLSFWLSSLLNIEISAHLLWHKGVCCIRRQPIIKYFNSILYFLASTYRKLFLIASFNPIESKYRSFSSRHSSEQQLLFKFSKLL